MPGLPQRWELGNLPSTDRFLSSPLAEIPQVGLGCESHVEFGKSCRIKAESLGPQAWWQGEGGAAVLEDGQAVSLSALSGGEEGRGLPSYG